MQGIATYLDYTEKTFIFPLFIRKKTQLNIANMFILCYNTNN